MRVRGGTARRIPIDQLFQQPTDDARRLTVLAPGEIITEVRIPTPAHGSRSTYVKATERRVWSFALASVAAVLTIRGGVVKEAKVVVGGVAPTPWPAPGTAEVLLGKKLTTATIEQAAQAAVVGARPLAKNGYKIALVKGIVTQALTELAAARNRP